MKKFKNFTLILAASFCLLFNACEKDDHPSPFPSAPDSFYPPNGAVISETSLKLNASGSIVDSNNSIHYAYYLGTDTANMNERSEFLKDLTPGTKYYWKAVPYTWPGDETFFGDESDVYHFYTQANIQNIESNYADKSIILTWEEPDNCKNIIIAVAPKGDLSPAYTTSIDAGQESFTIKNLQNKKIYSITIYGEIAVADTIISTSKKTVDEMALDTTKYARDIDYNIYNLVKIGDQVWMKENLRVSRFNDGTSITYYGHEISDRLFKPSDFLEGGSEIDSLYGYYYQRAIPIRDPYIAPKGFRLPTLDDFLKLFSFISGEDVTLTDQLSLESCNYGKILKASTGWNDFDGNSGNGDDTYGFAAYPSGSLSIKDAGYTDIELSNVGNGSSIFVKSDESYIKEILFVNYAEGVRFQVNWDTCSIRCIKITE